MTGRSVEAQTLDVAPPPLLQLYETMTLIRIFEERALELCAADEIYGVVHPYTGHEAIAAGACAALQPSDPVASYYRGHGHALARGVDPARMMAEMFGRQDGLCGGRGGSMHLADWARGYLGGNAIVGANLPIAVGLAIAAQVQQNGQVVAVFFGDGATGAGIVHECLNIASVQQLPMIFICENNFYQDLTPSNLVLASTDLARLGQAHLMPATTVDGNDPLAVWQAVAAAAQRARAGAGPSFIEAQTYLLRFHSQIGATPPRPYRPPEEVAAWEQRDPLPRLRTALVAQGVSPQALADIDQAVARTVEAAVAFARASPFPTPESALEGLLAPV